MFGYHVTKHPALDYKMICLWYEEDHNRISEIKVVPELGANLCSFAVNGIEYLHQAPMPVIDTLFFGTPVLYPFPNRVRDCQFTFDNTTYTLPDNDRGRTLHGLVAGQPFTAETPIMTDDEISVKLSLEIAPGHPVYALFPIANRLEITYKLTTDAVTIHFNVINLETEKRFPFGLGIHPYFNVHGAKDHVAICVPAKSWMEAVDLLPTGKLIDMEKAPADLRTPHALSTIDLDDVWFGMDPMHPQYIVYEQLGKKLVLYATDIFTHSVTYTPSKEAFFCLENQTNSTDAHNLTAKGLIDEAHLLILNPGESLKGAIKMKIEPLH